MRIFRSSRFFLFVSLLAVVLAAPVFAASTSMVLNPGDKLSVRCEGDRLRWDRTSSLAGTLECRGTVSSTTTTAPSTTTSTQPSTTTSTQPSTTTTTQPPLSGPYRAYSASSWWNTMLGAAPVDPNSSRYVQDLIANNGLPYMRLVAAPNVSQSFGMPTYWAKDGDPEYTFTGSPAGTVKVRIPAGAKPMTGSDAKMVIFDRGRDQVVNMGVTWDGNTYKLSGSLSRYRLSTDGIDKLAGGDPLNLASRGRSPAHIAVRVDEVAAQLVAHRMHVFLYATGTQYAGHYWPMTGDEGAKGGIIPEGIVMRIKPSVNLAGKGLSPAALTIARALQDYGAMVGDNSGGGSALKLELDADGWTALGILSDSLKSVPWSDFEFVQGGYRP